MHGHKNIYLIGYDFREYGKNKLNNIYQDSDNYGERHNDTIFDGWLKQFRDMLKMRVESWDSSATLGAWARCRRSLTTARRMEPLERLVRLEAFSGVLSAPKDPKSATSARP